MPDIKACRICLTTERNLIKIHEDYMIAMYENLIGQTAVSSDSYPLYVCMYCRHLLHKCVLFKRKCLRTQELLNFILEAQQQLLSQQNVRHLSEKHGTALPYTRVQIEHVTIPKPDTIPIQPESITLSTSESPVEIKQEFEPNNDEPLLTYKNSYYITMKYEEVCIDFDADRLKVENEDVEENDGGEENDDIEYTDDFKSNHGRNHINNVIYDSDDSEENDDIEDNYDFKINNGSKMINYNVDSVENYGIENTDDFKSKNGCNVKKNDVCGKDDGDEKDDFKSSKGSNMINYNVVGTDGGEDNDGDEKKNDFRSNRNSEVNNDNVEDIDDIKENDDDENDDGVEENADVDENDAQTDINEDSIQMVNLTKEEQLKEIEERKESYNYLNSFYKCEFCYKGFLTESSFKNHMMKHDTSSGKQVCEICKIRCPDAKSLKSHVVISHSRKYICGLCSHVSRSAHRAKEHLQWHRGKKYSCHVCGASFAKSTSQLTHLRLRHPSKFKCDLCGDSFVGLEVHKRKAHRNHEKSSAVYACVSCNVQFDHVDALNKHRTYSDGGECDTDMCPCVHCGENLTSRELLDEHLKKVHPNQEPIKCNECNRMFVNDRSYAMHYHRVHLGIRKLPKEPDKRKLTCEICGTKCSTNAYLVLHQRTHTGEKPYQCPDCPKRFSMMQRLQIHQRVHTGERPFQCSQCPKAFKNKTALNRHDRVHTGAKPYECAHCGKAFSQSNSMKLHVRTVHDKLPKPYRSKKSKDVT